MPCTLYWADRCWAISFISYSNMNDQAYIYAFNCSKEQLLAAIQAMANLYADVEYAQGIQLRKAAGGNDFLITFDNRPDFEQLKV